MPVYKDIELKDAQFKYGFKQQGLFSKEIIKPNELIFECDKLNCYYLKADEINAGKTRQETIDILENSPSNQADFIRSYIYMMQDDLYDWPSQFLNQTLNGISCLFLNHSCEPNCVLNTQNNPKLISIKEIKPDDELTFDYQLLDTEASFYSDLECKCASKKCRGKLNFNLYRNLDWQMKYYDNCSWYVKDKIDKLKTKWYSSSCYLKFYPNDQLEDKREYGLTVLKKVDKDELVAKFIDKSNINRDSHFIRDSKAPTCYLFENRVYCLNSFEQDVELTLDYSKI